MYYEYYPSQEQIDYDYVAGQWSDDYFEYYKDETAEYNQYFAD